MILNRVQPHPCHLPSGCGHNLLLPHLPVARQGRLDLWCQKLLIEGLLASFMLHRNHVEQYQKMGPLKNAEWKVPRSIEVDNHGFCSPWSFDSANKCCTWPHGLVSCWHGVYDEVLISGPKKASLSNLLLMHPCNLWSDESFVYSKICPSCH
jgi:hypothetical protein